jgi:hypothetical protein
MLGEMENWKNGRKLGYLLSVVPFGDGTGIG